MSYRHPFGDVRMRFSVPQYLPELHPKILRQRFEHFLMGGVHFFGFEGAVGGAVLETVGDGLAVSGQLFAGGIGKNVEALGGC